MAPERAKPNQPVSKLDPKMAATLRHSNALAAPPTSTRRPRPANPLFRLRLAIVACCYLALSIKLGGLILERQQVVAWLGITLIVANFGNGSGAIKQLVRDWIPLFGVVLAYDYSRGAADSVGMPVHWSLPITFDELLFGEVPSVRLQRWMNIGSTPHWYEAITAAIYVSHFFLTYVVLAALWATDRELWGRYFRAFIAASAIGLIGYVLMPMAPPWMAAEQGLIGEVTRSTNNGWTYLNISVARLVVDHGQRLSNNVAAFPSLHLAFSALPLFMFWSRARVSTAFGLVLRVVLIAYPIAMAFSIVSSGEHYVLDLIAGLVCAGLSAKIANRLVDRKVERGQPMGLLQE